MTKKGLPSGRPFCILMVIASCVTQTKLAMWHPVDRLVNQPFVRLVHLGNMLTPQGCVVEDLPVYTNHDII